MNQKTKAPRIPQDARLTLVPNAENIPERGVARAVYDAVAEGHDTVAKLIEHFRQANLAPRGSLAYQNKPEAYIKGYVAHLVHARKVLAPVSEAA